MSWDHWDQVLERPGVQAVAMMIEAAAIFAFVIGLLPAMTN